jgi:transcriptional regulator with XRE-family HTH domain
MHGQTVAELVDMISSHCGHTRLRAHRLARGWTLEQLIREMVAAAGVGGHLVTSRVSRWERGEENPSSAYRDALCRLYRTGPVELGLGTDYSTQRSDAGADTSTASTGASLSSTRTTLSPRTETEGPFRRDAANAVRRRVDETLSASTLADATIAHKEAVAEQYGRTYKTQDTRVFLDNILADLDDVQVLTNRRLPSGQRRDLCAVTARMAGLVSMTMVNVGQFRQARDWVHTARLAADEAGDPQLRAWVATRGAVTSLHLGDPQAASAAAREAEVLTHRHPVDVTAMAWAILARAAAIMAEPQVARAALHRAESLYGSVADSSSENSAYRFTAGQLHFYRSHALTTIGATAEAWQAQDDALAAFHPGERLDPTLVHLDRGLCMVANGDVSHGVDYANTILQDLPPAYRPPIVLRRARAITAAVPATQRALPAVRALTEALAIGPEQ